MKVRKPKSKPSCFRHSAPQFLLHEFRSAPHLSYLHLPKAYNLGLGYDGGPWCSNGYFGAKRREYGRQITRQRMDATEEASKTAFKVLAHLKT
jgi:hypothetical protein